MEQCWELSPGLARLQPSLRYFVEFLRETNNFITFSSCLQGCNLDVINLMTNERLAAWSFSSLDSADPEAEITCLSLVSGVSGDPRSNNPTHVILGLDTGLHGALAVFDITEGRVVRSLVLPQRVASLAILASSGGPSVPSYIHGALMYFHGIVALGLLEGKVLLIGELSLVTETVGC